MNQKQLTGRLFFAAAVLSMIAAFLPLVKGDSMNVVFLGTAVVFFVIGISVTRADGAPRN